MSKVASCFPWINTFFILCRDPVCLAQMGVGITRLGLLLKCNVPSMGLK